MSYRTTREPEVEPDNPYLSALDAPEEERDPDALNPDIPPPTGPRRSRFAPIAGHLVERGHFSNLPVIEGAGGWKYQWVNPDQHRRDLARLADIERRRQEEEDRRANLARITREIAERRKATR